MGEVIVSVCLSVHTQGVPLLPHPSQGYPSPHWGCPSLGVPPGWDRAGVPPGWDWTGVPLGQDWGTPLDRTGVPAWDRLCCGWYTSCGFPQEHFLFNICVQWLTSMLCYKSGGINFIFYVTLIVGIDS